MSEPNPDKSKHVPSAISIMSPDQIAVHSLANDLADAAWLHDAGMPGMTEETLRSNRHTAYTVARNGLESALPQFKEPYAQRQVDALRADGQIHPEPK